MERISIFNYEAFYLDFLEGNLSEEDTVLLFEFFEKHPELKLEDDVLITLNHEQPKLDDSFKAGLKQIEFNEVTITEENIEHFMIAETEGLLTDQKVKELDRFVGSDSERKKLRRTFAATRLKPDVRVVFEQKDALKRGRKIALWPVISFAAAACAVVLFLLWDPADSAIQNQVNQTVAQNKLNDTKGGSNSTTENGSKDPVSDGSVPVQVATTEVIANIEHVDPIKEKSGDYIKMDVLEVRRPTTLPEKGSDPQIIRTTYSKPQQNQVPNPENDYTVLGFDDMNNPIKPITNRLADVVKQEVDFRTAKPTEKRSGGFYVKIGKFELSHRKFR